MLLEFFFWWSNCRLYLVPAMGALDRVIMFCLSSLIIPVNMSLLYHYSLSIDMSILKSCEESFGLFFWKPVVAMSLVLCFMNYIHFWKDAYVLFSLIYFLFVCRHNWHCGLHKLWWYEACSKSSSFNYGVISSDVRPCFLMITRVYFVFSSADQKTWWLWV